jgi:hypothetical protein
MDFEKTDIIELRIARHYEPVRGTSWKAIGNIPSYDLKFANGDTLECKLDERAESSRRVCIEFWDTNRGPSGITATTASHWVHCIPDGKVLKCYETTTKKLLRLCIESDAHIVSGGDDNVSRMKLIPFNDFKTIIDDEFEL